MNKNALILITFTSLTILAIVGSILSMDWEQVELETGLSESALQQPLLAANLLLQQHNASLEKLERSNRSDFFNHKRFSLATNSTLIIDEGALSEYPNIAQAILTWLKGGGHLVYVLSPRREQLALADSPLLHEDLAVIDSETPARRRSFSVPSKANINILDEENNFDIYLSHQFSFENCPGTAIKEEETEATLICHFPVEQGHISYLPSIDLIASNNLQRLDHGQFVLWLLGNSDYMFSTLR